MLEGSSLEAVKLILEPFLQASCQDPPGLYSSLAALIWISVSAAIWSFWVTSSAVCLVLPRTTIRLSSSTSEPCQENIVTGGSSFDLQEFFPCIYSRRNKQECSFNTVQNTAGSMLAIIIFFYSSENKTLQGPHPCAGKPVQKIVLQFFHLPFV